MKYPVVLIFLLMLATPEPGQTQSTLVPDGGSRDACDLTTVVLDWNFEAGGHGFTTAACDENAEPVWQYGFTTIIDGFDGYLWGTILDGHYHDGAGHALVSPYLVVTEEAYLLEIEHFLEAENERDGCNVRVLTEGRPSQIIHPVGGYTTDELSPDGPYTDCVNGEPAWTGHTDPQWRIDCFDLTEFMGDEIQLAFDFGSDAAVNYRGWYLAQIRVGASSDPVAACCFSGECSLLTEAECAEYGGTWYQDLPHCEPSPCPPGPLLRIGDIISPETWHDYVGPTSEPLHLTVDLPRDQFPVVDEVRFVYAFDDDTQWYAIGSDVDGSEPILDTFGTSHPEGDGWSVDWVLPTFDPAPTTIRFAANVYTPDRAVTRFESAPVEYDEEPPEEMSADIEDIVVVSNDTLGVPVDPGGADIEEIYVYRYPTSDYFHKGVPGIDQNQHSPTSCAPAAAGQCLEYFDAEGDPDITGGLSSYELLLGLATMMRTNVDTVGTSLSNWVNGIREWVQTRGNNYTVQAHRHFDESGTSTWTRDDWIRIRDALQRCNDVLLGFYWPNGGAHSVTLNGISHTVQNGRFEIEFRDPWTGSLQYADIDTASGVLHDISGSGFGGTGFLGSAVIVAPREIQIAHGYAGDLVYVGPLPPGPEHIVPIGLIDPGHYLIQIIGVNDRGHASAITGMVKREVVVSTEEEEQLPLDSPFGIGFSFCSPNPFGGETQIAYTLPIGMPASVVIYDISGRKVRDLFTGVAPRGENMVAWDGRGDRGQDLPSGIYYVRLTAGDERKVLKVTLLR